MASIPLFVITTYCYICINLTLPFAVNLLLLIILAAYSSPFLRFTHLFTILNAPLKESRIDIRSDCAD